jgi:hypothetical protein
MVYTYFNGSYSENIQHILIMMMSYEIGNSFIYLLENNSISIHFIHHVFASIFLLFLYLYNDTSNNAYYDGIYCTTLLLMSNLPYTLYKIYPNYIIFQIWWFIFYLYFRLILPLPFVIKILTFNYYHDYLYISLTGLGFYILSLYWFYLIVINIFRRFKCAKV